MGSIERILSCFEVALAVVVVSVFAGQHNFSLVERRKHLASNKSYLIPKRQFAFSPEALANIKGNYIENDGEENNQVDGKEIKMIVTGESGHRCARCGDEQDDFVRLKGQSFSFVRKCSMSGSLSSRFCVLSPLYASSTRQNRVDLFVYLAAMKKEVCFRVSEEEKRIKKSDCRR